jgi:F-type H+-transporting ATPase subunit b
VIDQAREEIRREKDAALGQLRAEVADLAVLAAGKLLDANLDTAASRKLVDAAIRDLPKS